MIKQANPGIQQVSMLIKAKKEEKISKFVCYLKNVTSKSSPSQIPQDSREPHR
jgi:putative IMPACT (imprinted ancient) family translation regulator